MSFVLAGVFWIRHAQAATFIVNLTSDGNDSNPGDGRCDSLTLPGIQCTLRAAIQEANALAGTETITFNIGAGDPSITPLTPLPAITSQVVIDGNTGGAVRVQLVGSSAGGADGLLLDVGSGGSQIRSLIIRNFANYGIVIRANGNTVQNCFIGTDGASNQGNGLDGIIISGGADNLIGGNTTGTGNIITGNNGNGLTIFGLTATGNRVQGNTIGAFLFVPGGNGSSGVNIDGAPGNTIGGTETSARNVISGNKANGVLIIHADASGNQLQGNYIGTNNTGTAALGNTLEGVRINGGSNNTIGGAASTARNVISGNNSYGVFILGSSGNQLQGNFIGTNVSGTAKVGNQLDGVLLAGASQNTIGGTTSGTGNLISGNGGSAITFDGQGDFGSSTNNLVQGNFIGTDVTGTVDLGNNRNGVSITACPNNTIVKNVISGNDDGVRISGGASTNNKVEGNFIGTDASATASLGNDQHGVTIDGAPNNTVGGTAAAARNIISRNGSTGVLIINSGASGNKVQGNYVGTDVTGTAALGNIVSGIAVLSASSNIIGGITAGAGNLISGNTENGVSISGGNNNQVLGNFIGTDVTGTKDLGNSKEGVAIINAPNNIVGGTASGARNVISGNNGDGVWIDFNMSTGNKVQGNFIGTDLTGTANLGNSGNGVHINAATNLIGGTATTSGNLISGNAVGVFIEGRDASNNQVQGNFIGTDVTGAVKLGNSFAGVLIDGGPNNTIGGTDADDDATDGNVLARNVISGNNGAANPFFPELAGAVYIFGSTASGNQVQGNFIGTNANGTTVLGNIGSGVLVILASNNIIGGTAAGARNLISGNSIGVTINGDGASGNNVQGNFIGTDVTGTAALGNRRGVLVTDAPTNTIGGTVAEARNVVSGNTLRGVDIFGSGASGNQVQGNYIGTDVNGTAPLGNGSHGVDVGQAPNNRIGGAVGQGNIIAFNGESGVIVTNGTATGNSILTNSIYSNGNLGIDLNDDAVTANDPLDPDSGPNNLQKLPCNYRGNQQPFYKPNNSSRPTQFDGQHSLYDRVLLQRCG